MLDVQQTINNLLGVEYDTEFPYWERDLHNDIICCFDNTSEYVYVSIDYTSGKGYAYEDIKDGPIIEFLLEHGKITEAWEG